MPTLDAGIQEHNYPPASLDRRVEPGDDNGNPSDMDMINFVDAMGPTQ